MNASDSDIDLESKNALMVIEGLNMPAVADGSANNFTTALKTTVRSHYFYASLLYIVHSAAMMLNSYYGDADRKNDICFIFGIIFLFDACLYFYACLGRGYFSLFYLPDIFNIINAALWLWSACLYGKEYSYDYLFVANTTATNSTGLEGYYYYEGYSYTDSFYSIRDIELAASVFDLFASVGYVGAWYYGYKECYGGDIFQWPSGRGANFIDPDFHANWSIIAGAIIYLVYEIHVYIDNTAVATDFSYQYADVINFFNSICYMISALRDYGWFFWFPAYLVSFEFIWPKKTDFIIIASVVGPITGDNKINQPRDFIPTGSDSDDMLSDDSITHENDLDNKIQLND